jgi:hypothetical protein
VRHVKLIPDASVLDRPGIRALIRQAIEASDVSVDPKRRRKLVIRSVSSKYRNVRPRSS